VNLNLLTGGKKERMGEWRVLGFDSMGKKGERIPHFRLVRNRGGGALVGGAFGSTAPGKGGRKKGYACPLGGAREGGRRIRFVLCDRGGIGSMKKAIFKEQNGDMVRAAACYRKEKKDEKKELAETQCGEL